MQTDTLLTAELLYKNSAVNTASRTRHTNIFEAYTQIFLDLYAQNNKYVIRPPSKNESGSRLTAPIIKLMHPKKYTNYKQ